MSSKWILQAKMIGVQLMDVYLGQEQRKRRLLLEAFKGEINKDFFLNSPSSESQIIFSYVPRFLMINPGNTSTNSRPKPIPSMFIFPNTLMRFSLSLVPLPLHKLGSQPQVVREDLKDDLIPAHSRSKKIFFDCSKKVSKNSSHQIDPGQLRNTQCL